MLTTRSICHGENVDTLAALTTFENPDSIAFVYFSTAQTDSSIIYTGGTGIDTVQIAASNDTARITNVSGFTNIGSGTQQYFVYAIAHPTPTDITCRPYEEIIVNVKSVVTVSVPDVAICDGQTANITATVGNTGSKPSLYTWTVPSGETNPGNVVSFSASTTGTYSLSVYNNGCIVTDSGILTINSNPTVTATTTEVTCSGSTSKNDGKISLTGFTTEKYDYNIGAVYTGSANFATATNIPVDGIIVDTLVNPISVQTYTVRIFSSSNCYIDRTITLSASECCKADICLPVTVTIKRGK